MLLLAIGFVAQLVDGALGMAYGVLSNAAILSMGLPPAQASALVHTAEIFTTGASAASHIYHRNVDWRLVTRLVVTGVLGAVLGAWILSNIDIAAARRLVYGYLLLMGLYILWKSMRIAPAPRTPSGWAAPLGFLSGFLDASGGGGWGPVTTSTLIGSGHAPRQTVGLCQHHRVRRDRCSSHHILCGTRRLTAGAAHSTRARRRAGGTVRRMGGQARAGSGIDDGSGRTDRDALYSSALARLPIDLAACPEPHSAGSI
jgi:Sulfite exporter TauE/SafE